MKRWKRSKRRQIKNQNVVRAKLVIDIESNFDDVESVDRAGVLRHLVEQDLKELYTVHSCDLAEKGGKPETAGYKQEIDLSVNQVFDPPTKAWFRDDEEGDWTPGRLKEIDNTHPNMYPYYDAESDTWWQDCTIEKPEETS